MTTIQTIPLYRLEAARSRLEALFDPESDCCLEELSSVTCGAHGDGYSDPGNDPEYLTLRDLLDDLIEEARP